MIRWLLLPICLSLSTLLFSGCTALSRLDLPPSGNAPVVVAAKSLPSANATTADNVTCAATSPVVDQPPDDPNADPFGPSLWHINADRTLWVAMPTSGVWHTGGEKVGWIRPAGTDLQVSGQRLDGASPPLRVEQPCCYPTGFQVNGLYFPTAGCWEVTAQADNHTLRFVIEVREEGQAPPTHVTQQMPARSVDPTAPLAKGVLLEVCDTDACELRLLDATTGMAMVDAAGEAYAPLQLGRYANFVPTADQTQLALISYADNTTLRDGQLAFVNLATWEQEPTELTFDGVSSRPRYSPDASRLVVTARVGSWPTFTDTLSLVDVASRTLLAEQTLDFYPEHYEFTADGRALMVFGTREKTDAPERGSVSYVALVDATTLAIMWQATVDGLRNGQTRPGGSDNPMEWVWWQPGAAFDTRHARLYIVHADAEELTTVDFSTQEIATRAITQPLSWVERLLMLTARPAYAKMSNGINKQAMLAADGSRLFVIGTSHHMGGDENAPEFIQETLGLQVVNLATGRVQAHIETDTQSLTVDPTGNRVFLHGWATDQAEPYSNEWTVVLDADTLAQITSFEQAVATAHRLDGTPLLLATQTLAHGQTELRVLDARSFAEISTSTLPRHGYVGWVPLR